MSVPRRARAAISARSPGESRTSTSTDATPGRWPARVAASTRSTVCAAVTARSAKAARFVSEANIAAYSGLSRGPSPAAPRVTSTRATGFRSREAGRSDGSGCPSGKRVTDTARPRCSPATRMYSRNVPCETRV